MLPHRIQYPLVSRELRSADIDTLVIQSGRILEQAARELVPEERDVDGKPLMLGARMYRLRDRLDDEVWDAFQAWSTARNAYVHAAREGIGDRDEFFDCFETVLGALDELAEPEEEPEAEGLLTPLLIVAAVIAVALFAC